MYQTACGANQRIRSQKRPVIADLKPGCCNARPDKHLASGADLRSRGYRLDSVSTEGNLDMELYAGIDLHSNNSVVSVLDENDRVVYAKRLPNDLAAIIAALRSCSAKLP